MHPGTATAGFAKTGWERGDGGDRRTRASARATLGQPITGAIYALLVLAAVNSVAYLDRQITAILLQPIKLDLELTDTELGFHRRGDGRSRRRSAAARALRPQG